MRDTNEGLVANNNNYGYIWAVCVLKVQYNNPHVTYQTFYVIKK